MSYAVDFAAVMGDIEANHPGWICFPEKCKAEKKTTPKHCDRISFKRLEFDAIIVNLMNIGKRSCKNFMWF